MAISHGNVAALLGKHGYKEIRKVGEGSFGKALLVSCADGSKLICKMVDVSKASRKEMQDAVKEGQVLSELKHPYIVRYRESFTESGWLCILMDYAEGGDLTKQIEEARRKRQPIPEEQVLRWMAQAILALKYIHDKHILHRDLKPSNFFLSKGGSMKMGDFGIAKVLACTIAVAKTQIGTPYYLSPELCQEKPYAWPSDIWAMGCICYELCCLKVPFDAPSIAGLVQKIVKGAVPQVPSTYSDFTRQLCADMLNRTPDKRPSCDDILERPRIKAIVQKMLAEAQEEMGMQEDAPALPAKIDMEVPAAPSGPYANNSGGYKKGDLVDYWSSSHSDWLPASIINIDDAGRIVIDLKPNTWLSKAEQASKVRPRAGRPAIQRSPSAGRGFGSAGGAAEPTPRVCASPMRQRSPSAALGGRPPSRCASPSAGIQRSPSWCASPQRQNSPSIAGPRSNGLRNYRKGDLVEYWSVSHKDWLPATVTNTDSDGRCIIDLKPNTWLSKDDQVAKVRPRGGFNANSGVNRPASRGASPAPQMWRSPSGRDIYSGGTPRAMTPGRAPSPRRASSREPPARAESPWGAGGGAGAGTPRVRPPGMPPVPHRVSDSPLRAGGRSISGT